MLILSHEQVLACLAPDDCREAMAGALAALARGESHMPLRSVMMPPAASGFLGLMPGWQENEFGLKAVAVMPGNPARGLDSHQGVVLLFDGDSGRTTAVLEASALTERRTAAVSAVATDALARPDAAILGVLGAGTQARAHLEALPRVRDFSEIRVYAPNVEHARSAIADADAGAHGRVVTGAQEAVEGADVVVTATSSREPVLRREWLSAGTHVNAVGASSPASCELDTATVAAAALFCDSRESLRHEAREFALAIQEGLISGEEHVRAELGEVVAGLVPGRADPEEITLFRSLGLAVEDLAAARVAVARARELGLGTEVEL